MSQRRTVNRREFLRILGVGGVAGIAALKFGISRTASAEVVTETRLLMGTIVNLTLVTPDRRAGQAAIQACLDQMAGLEAVMSRHRSDSQLSRLNREGHLANTHPSLVRVLREAARFAVLTDGAFDVTVKPLVDLYERSANAGMGMPTPDHVAATLERVGYHHLQIEDSTALFALPGMAVTLDGIAKGYIVDEGTAILQQRGFTNILVEAGGDLSASGASAHNAPWRIGIQSPREGGARLLHTFHVTNRAAATSGDHMQSFARDFSAHHILDPRTGYSSPELASATVIASSGMAADALATAMMVMGPERGAALVETLPNCEAYLVTKDLHMHHSVGGAG